MKDHEAIRTVIANCAAAASRGDADAMVAEIAEDSTIFDVVPPLRKHGRDAAHARSVEWLSTYDGPPRWEDSELHIVADDSVAFAHMVSHVTGTLKSGAPVDMWFRTTVGFEKRGGAWLIVHDHKSDPFDPETGKARIDLRPGS